MLCGASALPRYIKIGHDNTGLGPSWHLKDIILSSPGMNDKQFIADRWLATDEGDGQTFCVLYPSGEGQQVAPKKYRIMVRRGGCHERE